ncbi:hypothetical protein F2Q69_00058395 [Brassica cretica]|uniref:Uncharacterized protein n=1 Tax=Brassica cretica TaxID=69181 RepID=A0A8S9RGV7_BRACR|nr:hypothetical protein F2Q69_00058395 [Brassica cretica]
MVKQKCCPELVQVHMFRSVEVLLDTPPGSTKNCPEAKEVEISPVHSSSPLGIGQVLSDQPAAYRHRTLGVGLFEFHLEFRVVCELACLSSTWNLVHVPVIFKDSFVAGGRTIWVQENPYSLDREHSERHGHGLWLSGYTDGVVTSSDPTVGCLARVMESLSKRSTDIRCYGSLQEAKSNLVTVALGKDDRIAWCWTLGPPE